MKEIRNIIPGKWDTSISTNSIINAVNWDKRSKWSKLLLPKKKMIDPKGS